MKRVRFFCSEEGIRKWSMALLLVAALIFSDQPAIGDDVQPIAGWNSAIPEGLELGEKVDPGDLKTFEGMGQNPILKSIRILPPYDTSRASECRVYWTKAPDQHSAVSLGSPMLKSIDASAQIAARVECGSTLPEPISLDQLTACIRFKMTGPMYYGGSPTTEMDGKLISLSPGCDIGILGSGPTGKQEHLIYIEFKSSSGQAIRYIAAPGSAIAMDRWTSLLVSWQLGADSTGKTGPQLWINEKLTPLQATSASINEEVSLKGPILVGGDGAYAGVPMELEGFAIYDKVLPWKDAFAALKPEPASSHENPPASFAHSYVPLNDLSTPEAWNISGEGLNLSALPQNVLGLEFTPSAAGKKNRILLKQTIDLRDNELFQFWICMPAFSGPAAGNTVDAIFTDAAGAESLVRVADFDNTHVAPPNGRAAGLWQVVTVEVPARKGKCQIKGFELGYQSVSAYSASRYLYLRDFGIDRTDYTKASLYYVMGNYRDNFAMVAFNGCGARALTDESGGSPYPFLLLDNAIDQAKDGRPKRVNLQIECFDAADRLVWCGSEKSMDASDSLAMFQKIEIPVTEPGTYWICSKSYDADTGEYFTTDWTQLAVIKGKAMPLPTSAAKRQGLLYINPGKPFGRLEKNDPRKIDFQIDKLPPVANGKMPQVQLKYEVVSYSPWVPGRNACRAVALSHTIEIKKPGVVSISYEPKSSVELVIGELWIDGRKMDRDERMIGIRNDIRETPKQDPSVRGIKELAALTGGLLINSHFNSLLDNCGDQALEVFTKNLEEARKISPLVEFIPSLERLEPMPGVYDWDYLQQFFDAAKAHQCALVLYFMQKWPTSWAPLDFMQNENGRAHHIPVVWTHMIGGYNYSTGKNAPEIIKDFNQQLARRFVNEPGFAAYYFENEHIPNSGPNSYDPGNRKKYQDFLQQRYEDISILNKSYGTSYTSFDNIAIPTSNPVNFPKKIMRADWEEYRWYAIEKFTLDCQFDVTRAEDPRRPIMVYTLGEHMSAPFLRHVADGGGLITNGGVHSVLDSDVYREQFCQIPGLLERMEPHDVFHYEPFPHGFDEMIFGMLGLGGRGMNFHFIVQLDADHPFSYDSYRNDGPIGYGKFLSSRSVIEDLRNTEKLHDPVGIMQLRGAWDYTGGIYNYPIRNMMTGIYVQNHYEPKIYSPRGDLAYLDDAKIIFVTGELIDKSESDYLINYVRNGGHVVLDDTAASMSFEHPDLAGDSLYLLQQMGLNDLAKGEQIDGLPLVHDVYSYGAGKIALIRSKDLVRKWPESTPAFMSWAGVEHPMASSEDPYMQIHTLRGPKGDYMALTHRGFDQNAYDGPRSWEGKARYLLPTDPQSKFNVTQVWGDKEESLGVMSAADLARGFSAGHFDELEMKLFRFEPVP